MIQSLNDYNVHTQTIRVPCTDGFDRVRSVGVWTAPMRDRIVLVAPPAETALLTPAQAHQLPRVGLNDGIRRSIAAAARRLPFRIPAVRRRDRRATRAIHDAGARSRRSARAGSPGAALVHNYLDYPRCAEHVRIFGHGTTWARFVGLAVGGYRGATWLSRSPGMAASLVFLVRPASRPERVRRLSRSWRALWPRCGCWREPREGAQSLAQLDREAGELILANLVSGAGPVAAISLRHNQPAALMGKANKRQDETHHHRTADLDGKRDGRPQYFSGTSELACHDVEANCGHRDVATCTLMNRAARCNG